MLCGGEALPRDLAAALLPCGASLWNMYGPTETTIWSSTIRLEAGDGPVPESIAALTSQTALTVLRNVSIVGLAVAAP